MEKKLARIGVAARVRPILNKEIQKGLMNTLVEVDAPGKAIV